MLNYGGIDIRKGTDLAKSNCSKECMICHYCFLNHGFKILYTMIVCFYNVKC